MSEQAMIFDQVVASRRSLRAFLPQAVDKQTLEHVFSVALRAPSNCNTQPWLVHVASGETLEKLRTEMSSRFMAGEITMDFPYDGVYEGVYKQRQHVSAQALYNAVNVTREDKAGRHQQFMRNFIFFDAPHVAFLFLRKVQEGDESRLGTRIAGDDLAGEGLIGGGEPAQRSTSPMIGSTDEMIATPSARRPSAIMWDNVWRFTKLGPLMCIR